MGRGCGADVGTGAWSISYLLTCTHTCLSSVWIYIGHHQTSSRPLFTSSSVTEVCTASTHPSSPERESMYVTALAKNYPQLRWCNTVPQCSGHLSTRSWSRSASTWFRTWATPFLFQQLILSSRPKSTQDQRAFPHNRITLNYPVTLCILLRIMMYFDVFWCILTILLNREVAVLAPSLFSCCLFPTLSVENVALQIWRCSRHGAIYSLVVYLSRILALEAQARKPGETQAA